MLKDIQLGKVYTDKDKPPFKVNEASDHEGQMAKSQLERSMEYAKMIYKIVDNVGDGGEVQMPAWVQSKLTKSMDYLQSVYNYFDGKDGLDDKSQNEAAGQNIKDQYVGEARVRVEPNTYKKQIRNYHSVSMYRDHRKPYNYYLSIILAHNKTNKIDMIISTGTHILSKAGKWAQGFMKRRMNGTGKERFD